MRVSILSLILCLSSSIVFSQGWSRDYDYVTEDRQVSAFTHIDVSSAIQVEITKGNSHSVSVKADKDIISYIKTEVSGDRLYVKVSSRKPNGNTGKMLVKVTMPALEGVEAFGASKVTTFSAFSGDDLELEVGGAAQVKVEFNGRKVIAEVSGAGTIDLVGSAQMVDYDANSAGSLRAHELTAKVAKVRSSSAASVRLTVTEEIDAKASSASSIRYEGDPKKVYTDTSSAATIRG